MSARLALLVFLALPVSAQDLAALAPAPATATQVADRTAQRAEAALTAWIGGDLAPLAALLPPERRAASADLGQFLDAHVRVLGAPRSVRAVGTEALSNGRRATLVVLRHTRGDAQIRVIWDAEGHLQTLARSTSR